MIPVQVVIPDTQAATMDIASLETLDHRVAGFPCIRMTAPLPPPNPSLVNMLIAFDPTRPRGVRVEVQGTTLDRYDELVRRGGGLGLAGRIWQGL